MIRLTRPDYLGRTGASVSQTRVSIHTIARRFSESNKLHLQYKDNMLETETKHKEVKKHQKCQVDSCNKAVLVTGCDTGFGHSLAKRLDSKGFHVFATCLFPSGEGATELKKSCSQSLHVLHVDVTKDDSVIEAVDYVKRNLGSSVLWAVVNNAGIHEGFTVELTRFSDFKDCMEVNAFGQLRVIQGFLSFLRQSKGRIVNVISNAGRFPVPHLTPYCMSKHAAAGLNDCLRQELVPLGVSVISVEPEMFKTPLTNKDKVNKCYEANLAAVKEDVRASYDENYMNRIKKLKDAYLHFTSPKIHLKKLRASYKKDRVTYQQWQEYLIPFLGFIVASQTIHAETLAPKTDWMDPLPTAEYQERRNILVTPEKFNYIVIERRIVIE
ncbi:estradiol 17-beta-dehydrogenase 2 [Nephila pilipes]|uniref:Estradiol 17-beta-dehydrogenase 2 n=1 Tax=Nephila pilipes TaxID=299642 RepID=A0A8X6PUX3_NEPPI|nr:estradiol 17-beta-dehydrogenase 2 [Nephila pilipes]